ncbi:MAG: YeiH family protein [Leptospirales bacterium]|nr:YeiH family protein [Leptospirales bacterium]
MQWAIRQHIPFRLVALLRGLTLASILALAAYYLATSIRFVPVSPVVFAVAIGLLLGTILEIPKSISPGISFSTRRLLRISVVLLGFKISFQDIASMGGSGLFVDLLVVGLTFGFAVWISRKVLGPESRLSYLIAVGCSICGASAILATAPIVKAQNHESTIAVGIVTLFGTIGMIIYPLLYHTGWLLGLDQISMGVFIGASIHEVAQVVSAGFAVSEQTGNTAIVTKMVRVMMLAPILLCLSWFLSRRKKPNDTAEAAPIEIPWFVISFVLAIALNSTPILSLQIKGVLNQAGMFLMLIAMSAIGLQTNLGRLQQIGAKPLYVGMILTGFLFCIGWFATTLAYSGVPAMFR